MASLTIPEAKYKNSFLQYVRELPFGEITRYRELMLFDPSEFEAFLESARQCNDNSNRPAGAVPQEYRWLVEDDEVVGQVYFLHWANQENPEDDGQIDYLIRPSQRQKGYGTQILRLTLERLKQVGTTRVLISCDSQNIASQKIILANGGVFESEIPDIFDSKKRWRYWISLAE